MCRANITILHIWKTYIMCINVLATCVSSQHICTLFHRGQKWVSDPLELELQVIPRQGLGIKLWQILWESSRCSLLWSHLPKPSCIVYAPLENYLSPLNTASSASCPSIGHFVQKKEDFPIFWNYDDIHYKIHPFTFMATLGHIGSQVRPQLGPSC